MVTKHLSIVMASLLFIAGGSVRAQEAGPKLTPLKVQIVLSRYDGEKKLSSMPYTLSVNASSSNAPDMRRDNVNLRMGVQVPVVSQGKDGPQIQYRNVGTNIECSAAPIDGGLFRIWLSIEQSSIYADEGRQASAGAAQRPTAPGQPMFRSVNSSFSAILKDGATTQYLAATDPLNGEVLKIDVTVNILK